MRSYIWMPVWAATWFLACNGGSSLGPDAGSEITDSSGPDENADAVEVPLGCLNHGTLGASSRCLTPVQSPEYYQDQANMYFDTLDVDADRDRIPDYSDLVARWEWPPWLLLTAYTEEAMVETADVLRVVDPSTVPVRDCRFFDVQPFARCYVEFDYRDRSCPIYEEFTFNDQGEMTFIEAWSDLPGLLPNGAEDRWAEAPDFPRLSTRIPGLGNETGRIDPDSEWMQQAAVQDPEVADFALRITDWWKYWFEALGAADEDFFAQGCGW